MLKWIVALGHGADTTRAELLEKWERVHIPHVVKVASPEGYRVTFFEPNADVGFGDPGADLDGMAELLFWDWDHFNDTFGSNASPDAGADGFVDYLDRRKGFQLFTTERVAVDAATSRETAKLAFFVKRCDGLPQEKLFAHWRDVHIPNVAAAMERTPSAGRYTVSLADQGRDGPYDGVAELYLDKPAATLADVQGIQEDGFMDLTQPGTMLALRGSEIRVI